MKEKRFNDIANFSNAIRFWDRTIPSSLLGWYWQAKPETHEGVSCLALLLMSDDPNERSAEFQTGLLIWREAVPADGKGVPNLEQAYLMASAKIVALEFILRNGVFQAEMEARKEEWRKKDQEIHRLKQAHQEEVQKLKDQIRVQEEAGLELLGEHRQRCQDLQRGVDAATAVVAATEAKGKGAAAGRRLALDHLKAALNDLDQSAGQPCKYQVTDCPKDAKIRVIQIVREATGMRLRDVARTVKNGDVFRVPYEKLQGFCLDMEKTTAQWKEVRSAKEVVVAAEAKGKRAAYLHGSRKAQRTATGDVGQPCKYHITYWPSDVDGIAFQDKIKVIKAIREATGMDLSEAKKVAEDGTVFEVPYEKLHGFCLGLENASAVGWVRS